MSSFRQYSAYYDLLYAEKDYAAEADYVAAALRRADPGVRRILELGSGTGRHGRLLSARGFEVEGVERRGRGAAQSTVTVTISALRSPAARKRAAAARSAAGWAICATSASAAASTPSSRSST
jgi:SAM-dependent methyltransferase